MKANMMLLILVAWLGAACSSPVASVKTSGDEFLDQPFPNALMQRDDYSLDFSVFPVEFDRTPIIVESFGYEGGLVSGYRARTQDTVTGYGANGSFYFVAEPTDGKSLDWPAEQSIDKPAEDDPVWVYACQQECELVPFTLRYVEDATDDPYLHDHTVVVTPGQGRHWPSGAYIAVVANREIFEPVEDWQNTGYVVPSIIPMIEAQTDHVALAFGVWIQDALAEIDALRAAADQWYDKGIEINTIREVNRLRYRNGLSDPNKEEVIVVTTEYADNTTGYTEFERTGEDGYAIDVTFATVQYPFRAFELEVTLPNFRGIAEAPYGSPGIDMIGDLQLRSGQIKFNRTANGVVLRSNPEPETVRLLVQLPLQADGSYLPEPDVLLWEHGTGGSIYNAVHRVSMNTGNLEVSKVMGSQGYAIVSRDQPLFGRRYPLYDQGYNSYLGAYNLANITAFRDYIRQAATEAYIVGKWAQESMAADVIQKLSSTQASEFDQAMFRAVNPVKFGHSLGAQMGNVSLAFHRDRYPYAHGVLSGAGGIYLYFGLYTGLLNGLDDGTKATIRSVLGLIDIEIEGELTARKILAGALGLGPSAEGHLDVWHPIGSLFQTLVDPGDPSVYTQYYTTPETLITGVGDYQVPNVSTEWLEASEAPMEVVLCEASWDYDPHQCTYAEPHGNTAVKEALIKAQQ